MAILQALGTKSPLPPPGAAPTPPTKTTPPATRQIADMDLFDRLGIGAWADIAVITVLAAILGAVLLGVCLWALRKAFGSTDDQRAAWSTAEKTYFDLVTRKSTATAAIEGLKRQIAAVERDMDQRSPSRSP